MKKCILIFVSAICNIYAGSLSTSEISSSSAEVDMEHRIYKYIDALPLPGIINGVNIATKPYSKQEILTILNYALTLKGADSLLIQNHLAEFTQNDSVVQIKDKLLKIPITHKKNYVIIYPTFHTSFAAQDSGYSTAGFSPASIDSLSSTIGFNTENDIGIVVRANIHNVIMNFNGKIITEYSTEEYWEKINNPRLGINQTTIFAEKGEEGNFMGSDLFRTYIKLPFKHFDLKIGNDDIIWGYAKNMNLIFSRQERPFFHVQFEKNIGKLDYQFIWGRLLADTYRQKRYIYAKRYNYQPFNFLTLGFSDEVITINRDIEPVYFIPFLPFYFSEHYLGDPDNRLISIDIFFILKQYFSIYTELLIDDIQNLTGFFSNNANDKWAFLLGLKIYNPIPPITSLLKCEFAQVEPWVYTTSSRDNDNAYNYPVHFGRILGNQYGPHSRATRLNLSVYFSKKINGSVQVEQIWKGERAGSSIYDINPVIFDTTDSGEIYLKQEYEKKEYRFKNFSRRRTIVTGQVNYNPAYWCTIFGAIGFIREKKPHTDNSFQFQLGANLNY